MPTTDVLNGDKIKDNLSTKRIGTQIFVYKSTSSTNDTAAGYAKNKNNDGVVIFSEEQTTGRGRRGNKWISKKGDSILCSIVLTSEQINPEMLCLTCAVAVAEAIGNGAKIKWPNDIVLNGKKVAGILLESKKTNNHTTHILGIGINCHQRRSDFPEELKEIATSIDIERGTVTDRNTLAKRLLNSIEHWRDIAAKNSRQVIEEWRKLSILLHHRVTVIYNNRKFTGNCIGIDPEKGLIVQLDTGSVRFFPAAHTTVAK